MEKGRCDGKAWGITVELKNPIGQKGSSASLDILFWNRGAFGSIWGYFGTELYSQKQKNPKLDRSSPKFYDLQGKELPKGTGVSGHAGSDQNSFYFFMGCCQKVNGQIWRKYCHGCFYLKFSLKVLCMQKYPHRPVFWNNGLFRRFP